jgi:hypothetical protein
MGIVHLWASHMIQANELNSISDLMTKLAFGSLHAVMPPDSKPGEIPLTSPESMTCNQGCYSQMTQKLHANRAIPAEPKAPLVMLLTQKLELDTTMRIYLECFDNLP